MRHFFPLTPDDIDIEAVQAKDFAAVSWLASAITFTSLSLDVS
jgi:hypothetical protein